MIFSPPFFARISVGGHGQDELQKPVVRETLVDARKDSFTLLGKMLEKWVPDLRWSSREVHQG